MYNIWVCEGGFFVVGVGCGHIEEMSKTQRKILGYLIILTTIMLNYVCVCVCLFLMPIISHDPPAAGMSFSRS